MKLIVGLGNPGAKYKYTRHNLGSLVVEAIAQELKERFKYSFFAKSKLVWLDRSSEKVCLLLPLTFMNLSGKPIAYVVKKRRLALEDILVICDDVNLMFSQLRIKATGSDGGHNGLKSVIESLNSQEFAKMRIGIGPSDTADLTKFVLSEFNKDQRKELGGVINKAVEASFCWVDSGLKEAMNKYNR